LVTAGCVTVNGKVVRDLATQIADTDNVAVDGAPCHADTKHVYIIMNKPAKYLTACSDERIKQKNNKFIGGGRKTVLDLLNFSAGCGRSDMSFETSRTVRADKSSLLGSNNGEFRRREKDVSDIPRPRARFFEGDTRQAPAVSKNPPVTARVFPVGRLDYDTEGLLFLTNDGEFAESVTHPTKKIEKTYEATLDTEFSRADLEKLCAGIEIDGEKTLPARAKIISKFMVELTITQGRNRQVRKMFAALGYNVTYLRRVKIGNVALGNLPVGKYKVFSTPPRI
jgi:pseudouridine synthase